MLVLLQTTLEASICRRRAPASSCVESEFDIDSEQTSDDAGKSTDASGPEQDLADSFDGSDTDHTDVMPNSEPTTGSSDGGSDAESSSTDALNDTWHRQRAPRTKLRSVLATRLNPHAAAFVPSTPVLQPVVQPVYPNSTPKLRESIRSVIMALEQWEASTAAEDYYQCQKGDQNDPGATVQSATGAVLQAALSRLTPDDSALFRAMLDTKLASENAAQHCKFHYAVA